MDSEKFIENVSLMHEDVDKEEEITERVEIRNRNDNDIVLPFISVAKQMSDRAEIKHIKQNIRNSLLSAIDDSLKMKTVSLLKDEYERVGEEIVQWIKSYGYTVEVSPIKHKLLVGMVNIKIIWDKEK